MARILLTLVLMFTTAVGPLPCCCSPARLIALFTAAPSAPGCPSCCGGDSTPDDDESNLSRKTPPNGLPAQPCPCKGDRLSTPVFITAESGAASLQARVLIELQGFDDLLVPANFLKAASGQLPGESVAFPFQSGRDILRALHLLRC